MWTNVTQVHLGKVEALAGRRAGVAAPVGGACVARLFVVPVNGRGPIAGIVEPAGRPVREVRSGPW
jgi:hypothetical protein